MKIAPLSSPANTVGAVGANDPAPSMAQRVRSVRMNTNATPGRTEAPPAPESLTNPDTVEPAPVEPEANEPLSPQLAALAKQRRALQVKERELADREKALAAQPPTQGDVITKAQLKSDPLSTLLEAGVTYDQLTEAILANQSGITPEINALKAEIKALKEGVDKTFSDRDAQSETRVLAEMQKVVTGLVAEGDTFELIRETKSVPSVMKLIKRTYDETGEVLSEQEACQFIEDELVQESLKIAGIGKVQSRLAPPAPVPPPPQQRAGMRTLTNRDTAQVPLSAKQRALAAFNGTLHKR